MVVGAVRTGQGIGWHAHDDRLFSESCGCSLPATPLVNYGLSTVICAPKPLSQEFGLGLGAQAGERRLTDVLREAGSAWCTVKA